MKFTKVSNFLATALPFYSTVELHCRLDDGSEVYTGNQRPEGKSNINYQWRAYNTPVCAHHTPTKVCVGTAQQTHHKSTVTTILALPRTQPVCAVSTILTVRNCVRVHNQHAYRGCCSNHFKCETLALS